MAHVGTFLSGSEISRDRKPERDSKDEVSDDRGAPGQKPQAANSQGLGSCEGRHYAPGSPSEVHATSGFALPSPVDRRRAVGGAHRKRQLLGRRRRRFRKEPAWPALNGTSRITAEGKPGLICHIPTNIPGQR